MRIFLDTAEPAQLEALMATGLIDGVTTNPSLIAKSGAKIVDVIGAMCALTDGPVSAEAVATDYDTMLAEGRYLAKIAPNVAVKLPLTPDGLRACRVFSEEGTMVNVTLCFSAVQALLAAKAGASFISPFVGRLDDNGADGMELIREIRQIYDNYGYETEILAASLRTPIHVRDAALAGADCATLPPATFQALYKHNLTDAGLAAFLKDWAATGQSIL
ncbi:MAG: fructose-6-phosphate aldolase [Hyphomonadaceae bacterium]|nr:fructose-6-phosphate aldolase [Hyphomonadaceae bacterium]